MVAKKKRCAVSSVMHAHYEPGLIHTYITKQQLFRDIKTR